MAEQLRVPFGTTTEQIVAEVGNIADRNGWNRARVFYVLDIKSCTVKETAYAVSNTTADLPLHPNGPDAVQKLA